MVASRRKPPKIAAPATARAAARRTPPAGDEVDTWHAKLTDADRAICDLLAQEIGAGLKGAVRKVWHGSPVWFLDGNPIVGYGKLKGCVRLLFWSGQSFDEEGLAPEGSFKAAEARYTSVDQVDARALRRWLRKSRTIQWDYENIVKRKGRLVRRV